MGRTRSASYGVLLCAAGTLLLVGLTVATPPSASIAVAHAEPRAVESHSEEPSAAPSEEPSEEASESPRPSRSPTPRPTPCGTVVCPTLTGGPSPTRPPTSSPLPTESEEPSPSPSSGRRSPDPLATQEDPESTAPEPVVPTIKVSELPVSQPSFDDSATEEPSPIASADAAAASGGRSVGQLFALALVAVVLLGGAGATGLYLTREPKGTP